MSGEYQWPRSSYSAVGEDEGLLVGALAGLDHDGGGGGKSVHVHGISHWVVCEISPL